MKDLAILCRSLWGKLPWRVSLAGGLALIVGLTLGRHLLGSFCIVSGSSMYPTLQEGALIHAEKISEPIQRGDIVVMDDGGKNFAVKRIVGLPGETVYIWRGYVYINGRILLEPYVPRQTYTFPRQRLAVFELGQEQFFVLGDNRPYSADSRLYGPVERKQIKRRVTLPETVQKARFGPFVVQPYGTILRVPIDPKVS